MKIIQGVLAALVLSLAEATQNKELMKTSLPESAMSIVEKIADTLCSVESPDLHYAVKLAEKIYNCDEEATGMIANLATTAVAESLVLKSRSNHNGLAVSDEFGSFGGLSLVIDAVVNDNFSGVPYQAHYATSFGTCLAVPQNECAAAGNAVTGWNKGISEVVVGDWSWVPCGCYIWRGRNIQFNTRACNRVVLNNSGRVNGQAICRG